MRKIIFILTLFAIAISCKINKKPEFVRINALEVVSADLSTVVLKAEAVFMNHNNLGGKLQTDNIDVFVDNNLIAKVSADVFKVPSKDEFTIPLLVHIDSKKIINTKSNGLLGALVKQLANKEIQIQFKGELTYVIAGYKASYPIDYTEDILIK